jgi:hypothetical protein
MKPQIPNTNHQRNPKFQAPSSKEQCNVRLWPQFGDWNLVLLWDLGIGAWGFHFSV